MKPSTPMRIRTLQLLIPNIIPDDPGEEEEEEAQILRAAAEDMPTKTRETVHLLRVVDTSLKPGAQPVPCSPSNRLSSNTRAGR